MEIKTGVFVEILKQGYSLNNVYILESLKSGTNIQDMLDFPTGKATLQGMERKGLISSTYEVTELGEKLIALSHSDIPEIKVERVDRVTRKEKIEMFDKWWETFPGTDTFFYKNRRFVGSRALRSKKEECRVLFEKILREGFTGEQMIEALLYEVMQKKEDSIKKSDNKLRFIQNSLTYLRQRTWEPYIELVKELGSKVKEEGMTEYKSVDI